MKDGNCKNSTYLSPEFRIGERYKLIKSIGKGSFGEVFLGQDTTTSTQVAVKIENSPGGFSQLTFESKVYRYLSDGVNVPSARLYIIDENSRALVMELLGPSLEELYRKCSRRFTLKTVCLLADQMLSLLEYLHIRFIIHRDIKPDNFLIGIGVNSSKVYIVDFGLAKQYCTSRAQPHVKYNNRKCMIGTARYASINAHLGIEQSRRDDLESLGYVLLYFYLGQLPWQGISADAKNRKYDKICERKLSISVETLCQNTPPEFCNYINYCRRLRFDERPDYMLLRQLFRNVLKENNIRYDYLFDWSSNEQFKTNLLTTTSPPAVVAVAAAVSIKKDNNLVNNIPQNIICNPKAQMIPATNLNTFQSQQVDIRNDDVKVFISSPQITESSKITNKKPIAQMLPVVGTPIFPPNRLEVIKNEHFNRTITTNTVVIAKNNVNNNAANKGELLNNPRYNLRSYKKDENRNAIPISETTKFINNERKGISNDHIS